MDSWILCPCQRSRLPMLKRLLLSLEHPADRVVVVTTHPNPLSKTELSGWAEHCLLAHPLETSISQWWNFGLKYIDAIAGLFHEVAVLSSDMQGTSYSIAALGVALRQQNLAMVGPNLWGDSFQYFGLSDVREHRTRVPGCCWMLAGETHLRCDEQFRWWYSDDDIEMQARQYSGVGLVPHTGLVAGPDTPLDEVKLAWAAEDRQKFIAKWGRQPW